jgi:hypothetical protein
MKRTKEQIEKEIDEVSKKWNELRDELVEVELGKIDIEGKYLYFEDRNLYIHVEKVWYSSRNDPRGGKEYEMIIEGESFAGFMSEYSDDTFFKWEQYDQITEHPRGGKLEGYIEINKEKFEEELDQLIEKMKEEIKSERQE